MFLLLAAQFEKWTLPIAVVLTVPIAVLGALLLTWVVGSRERRLLPGRPGDAGRAVGEERDPDLRVRDRARAHAGMAPREAAIEAAGLRLRAIVMTSLAFGLGCVPLAIATGPGANSLRAIGTGVIGGILASTVIATIFAPLFFWMLESASQRFGGAKSSAASGEAAATVPTAAKAD